MPMCWRISPSRSRPHPRRRAGMGSARARNRARGHCPRTTTFTTCGVSSAAARRGRLPPCRARIVRRRPAPPRRARRRGRKERLVALDVDDHIVARVLAAGGDFRDAIGARWVRRARGEHALGAGLFRGRGDVGMIGGDDAAVGDFERSHPLPDTNHEGGAGEEPERLAGEPRRTEPRRDHRQRAHGATVRVCRCARFTPVNIARRVRGIKHSGAKLGGDPPRGLIARALEQRSQFKF